jgi:hypothetical protein
MGKTVDKKAKPTTPLHPGWESFKQMHAPASTWKAANNWLTTTAVLEVLNNIVYADWYTEEMVYSLMKENGYTIENAEGTSNFYWLLQ